MKCYACGNENLTQSMSVCPDCHFMILKVVGAGGAEFEKAMKDMAAEYASKLRESISIGIIAYSYAWKNDELQLDKEMEMTLVEKASQLPAEGILWYDAEFARVEDEEPLKLQVFTKTASEKKIREVVVAVPKTEETWKVGIKKQENLAFRIVVGTKTSYSESENISMVR